MAVDKCKLSKWHITLTLAEQKYISKYKNGHESYCAREGPAKTRYSGPSNSLLILKCPGSLPQAAHTYLVGVWSSLGQVHNNKNIYDWVYEEKINCAPLQVWSMKAWLTPQ